MTLPNLPLISAGNPYIVLGEQQWPIVPIKLATSQKINPKIARLGLTTAKLGYPDESAVADAIDVIALAVKEGHPSFTKQELETMTDIDFEQLFTALEVIGAQSGMKKK